MADPKTPSKPEDQEQLVQRHPFGDDPTSLDLERTSDNSTVDNGGIGSGVNDDPALPDDEVAPDTKR